MRKMRRVNSSHTRLDGYKKIPLTVSISSTILVRNEGFFNRNYVQYVVTLASSYKTWVVNKRYSDFENFHNLISKKFHHLPPFPPKRLFRFSNATITERRTRFERYLNYLVSKVNICKFPELIDFLNIDNETVEIFIKNNHMISSSLNFTLLNTFISKKNSFINNKMNSSSGDLNSSFTTTNLNNSLSMYQENNYFTAFAEYKMAQNDNEEKETQVINLDQKSIGMSVIEEFLRNLQYQKKHKSEIVKTFTAFMKDKGKWRQFSKEEIIKLYTGEYSQREINSMNKQIIVNNKSITSLSTEETKNSINIITNKSTPLKGLFFHIGDFNSNCFGAIACLELLCRLTNYEFNPECDLYIYLLKTRPYDYLNEMRLGEYMKLNKRKCVEMSFKIIKLLINDEKNITKIMRKLNCDEEIIEKFKTMYEEDKNKLIDK